MVAAVHATVDSLAVINYVGAWAGTGFISRA